MIHILWRAPPQRQIMNRRVAHRAVARKVHDNQKVPMQPLGSECWADHTADAGPTLDGRRVRD